MEKILTLRDDDIDSATRAPREWKERKAARSVVFDKDGNTALLYVSSKDYHKIAGGGIEEGEDIETGLRREIMEEIGCSITNIRELGIIEEYRNEEALHQISYCFLADVSGEKGSPDFDPGEIADGFEGTWLSLGEAIQTLESERDVSDYGGKFIRLRDLTFLKAAQQYPSDNSSI